MKIRNQLLTTLLLLICVATACTAKTNTSRVNGPNPYYDEINRITFGEFEFRLDDTLSSIKETYDQLSISEEKMLSCQDDENPTFTSWNMQRVLTNIDMPVIKKVFDTGEESALTRVTVKNDTKETMSSYHLPIVEYNTGDSYCSYVSLPFEITNLIAEHRDEEDWEQYNEDKLCYTLISSEKWSEEVYFITVHIVVFRDQTFNQYLEYLIEGSYYILSDENTQEVENKTNDAKNSLLEQKETFVTKFISLKKYTLGIPQKDKSQDYSGEVLDFIKSQRNKDYFLSKDDITYTILQPYENFLPGRDLVQATNRSYTFQPMSDKLGAYGNTSAADTVRYTLTLDEENSDFLVLPVVTNFTNKSINTNSGLVTQVIHYGNYSNVSIPGNVEDALNQYWLLGKYGIKNYEYDTEKIAVSYSNNSSNGLFYECTADVTPLDYPQITIRYQTMVSFSTGEITDANFWLKDEEPKS
jgi:hypothetical protein